MRRYTVTLTALLSQSRAVRCEIGRARSLPGKCLGGGTERRTTQRDREGWRGEWRVELGRMLMLHWMDLMLVTGPRLFLIQSIFRANLAQLSSLTKLFWLLPHYHKAPSLSLLLLTDPLQISYCTHLTWHALRFSLISPHYWFPVPVPPLIHTKQA